MSNEKTTLVENTKSPILRDDSFFKLKRKKNVERLMHLYDLMANISIFEGWKDRWNLTELDIRKYWKYPGPFPAIRELRKIDIPSMQWYLSSAVTLTSKIWNAEFIQGLCSYGDINIVAGQFPIATWRNNPKLEEVLEESPFFGSIKDRCQNKTTWSKSPVLCLSFDPSSAEFLAGFFCSGQVVTLKNKGAYVRYNSHAKKMLEELHVPIEMSSPEERYLYISPMWGSLFESYMPKNYRVFSNLKNAAGVEDYAPSLFYNYVSSYFMSDRIPYLKSRKSVYRQHASVKQLELLKISKGIAQIDPRIINAVKKVAQISSKSV